MKTSKILDSIRAHRKARFMLVESDMHHGGKKNIVRHGFAESISRVTVNGKEVAL